jgi:dTMP kinase
LPGALIVLEGIDGSGRSTHARLLEDRLRYRGRGATRTSLATSAIAAEPIRRAKRDSRVGPVGTALLYAADLAERTEQVVLPALRAGLVVIADRYAYTPMARSEARGVDPAWLDDVFGFVVPPDLVLFLDVDPDTALARRGADPDPYEAGSDLHLGADLRESYRLFQGRLYDCLRRSADRFGFTVVPATGAIAAVERRLERAAEAVLAPAERRAPGTRAAGETAGPRR